MFSRVLSLLAPEHLAEFGPRDYRSMRLACKDGAAVVARCVTSIAVDAEDAPRAAQKFPNAKVVTLCGKDCAGAAAAEHFASMVVLNVWTGGAFQIHSMPRLRTLATDMRIRSTEDAMLLARCHLPVLEELRLESVSSHEAATALLTHAAWPALKKLSLRVDSSVDVEGERLGAAIAAARFPRLEALSLCGVLLGSAGVGALSAGEWPALASLDVRMTGMDSAAARRLSTGRWPALWHLEIYQSWSNLPSEEEFESASVIASESRWPRVLCVHAVSPLIGLLEPRDPTTMCRRIFHVLNARWPAVTTQILFCCYPVS